MASDPHQSCLGTYTLAPSAEEQQRLLAIARAEADRVQEACTRVGLGPGSRIIELGCGPLGALAALAVLVGPSGTVVGVEFSASAVATARAVTSAQRLTQVQVIEADVGMLQPEQVCPPGPFDAAFCRRFLVHQADPITTLRRMAALVRPGGWVLAHEPLDDDTYPAAEPPLAAVSQVWRLVTAAVRSRGGRTDVARHYAQLCQKAGLALVEQRGYLAVNAPAVGLAIAAGSLVGARQAVLGAGLSTPAELTALEQALRTADPTAYQWVSGPLMLELCAQVPRR